LGNHLFLTSNSCPFFFGLLTHFAGAPPLAAVSILVGSLTAITFS
jgi:hypothetical protein